jgi:hypothetical protein
MSPELARSVGIKSLEFASGLGTIFIMSPCCMPGVIDGICGDGRIIWTRPFTIANTP